MKKLILILTLTSIVITLQSCGISTAPNEIVVQRFFGACEADYGDNIDVPAAQGECGIITSLLNKFSQENPDIVVTVSTVPWPGYNQLSAQIGAGDAPDVVTMHESAIPDFMSRGLLRDIGNELKQFGVDPKSFTEASQKGVTYNDKVYGLPFDTWAPLWHINLNYFRKAGLIENGKPILPRNPAELLAHARQFKEATGKPYFVQALANQKPAYTRNFFTFLMQQNSPFFSDPKKINLQNDGARQIVEIFKTISAEGLTTLNQDYAAATSGFINGDGGVYLVGTWVIGDYQAESEKSGRPLSNGYTVYPFPQIFPQQDASFVDGHAWVMPVKERSDIQNEAVFRLMKFFADNNFEWARTGHLPAYSNIIDSEEFKALPHRSNIAKLSQTGKPLPGGVQRQFAIQDIAGEELAAAIDGQKTIDEALEDAELRINDLLFHVL